MSKLFFLGMVERSFPVPDDLASELENIAPQALLRDLHRVDKKFVVSPYDITREGVALDGGRRYTNALKRTFGRDYRVPIRDLVPTEKLWRQAIAEKNRTLRSDWTKAPKLASQEHELPYNLAIADWK